ncbi:MAG: hypothetical protein KJ970_21185 [Candidatus Eisenbacteria bacterium]|uniref:Uncharacterized protein n=1 Tax=Eiseniibacteriota bacterium TaxID=2212470 RepID=A0A948RYP2_UNCEI|nr:hypothetical protein [Candidatus Eisenbacteria bacterium]MBU1949602.1 hypothetical protein [Candidatus Eisenbacteria bacterium]MBU2693440.1 hypothetical protein [Candidatus Eisenbacteria bacterium]
MGIGESKCKHVDYGLLVSLFATRHGRDREAVKRIAERGGILDNYNLRLRDTISKYHRVKEGQDEEGLADWLYRAHVFSLWGPFDVGLITLIDDFEVASHLGKCDSITAEQLLVHAIPDLTVRDDHSGHARLILDPKEFYSPEAPIYTSFPLIGILQIKLNALLRIAFGNKLLYRTIGSIIQCCGDMNTKDMRVLILESLGWNELTLLIHAKSFASIATFIELVRSTRFDDLGLSATEQDFKSIEPFYGDTENLMTGHLIATTQTICGQTWNSYNSERESPSPRKNQTPSYDKVAATSSITTKPGHTIRVLEETSSLHFDDDPDSFLYWATFGRKDLSTGQILGCYSTQEFLQLYGKMNRRLLDNPNPGKLPKYNTYHSITELAAPVTLELLLRAGIKKIQRPLVHREVYRALELLKLSDRQSEIKKLLKADLGFPKAVITEILHLTSMLDMCIEDPLLFDLFLDYIPMFRETFRLLRFAAVTENITRSQRGFLCRRLSKFVDRVGHSMKNSYERTYATADVTELSIEFKGAYQDLLCAVTGFVNAMLHASEMKDIYALPIIQGVDPPECFSGLRSPIIRLNHLDLLQPEGWLQFGHELAHSLLRDEWAVRGLIDLNLASTRLWQRESELGASRPPVAPRLAIRHQRAKDTQYLLGEVICDIYSYYFCCSDDKTMFSCYFWLNHCRGGQFELQNSESLLIICIRFFSVLMLVSDEIREYDLRTTLASINRWISEMKLSSLSPIFSSEENDSSLNLMGDWGALKILAKRTLALVLLLREAKCEPLLDWLKTKSSALAGMEKESIPGSDTHGPLIDFYYCRRLILDHCQTIWAHEEINHVKWISRAKDGAPILKKNHSRVLVDLRGGTFIVDPATRRKYFHARVHFFYKLLDYAHWKKRDLLIQTGTDNERRA